MEGMLVIRSRLWGVCVFVFVSRVCWTGWTYTFSQWMSGDASPPDTEVNYGSVCDMF